MNLLTPAVRLGIVAYGGTARVISPLTSDHARLLNSLDAANKPGGDADTVQGLIMSKNLLQASSDSAVQRQQHVLLIMGEQPTRPTAAGREAKRMDDLGMKVSVALIHATQSREEETCAMLPGSCKDKVELIPSWIELRDFQHSLVVAVCDVLLA
eukprot:2549239-Amphidinium_carterae.1